MQIVFGTKLGQIKNAYTFDHRVALSEGGENTVDNMVICCYKCNQEKSWGEHDRQH
jgi:5-methylcytosine-specific restriction endonuclease McrA